MAGKPQTAAGYRRQDVELVRRTTLYFATRFDDLLDDLTIAGGYVPSLLVPQPEGDVEAHVGTRDLDLGLQLALLDEEGYATLADRLRQAGFRNELNQRGNPRHQAWVVDLTSGMSAVIEFLVPPRSEHDRPGRLARLDEGLAAIVVPGLELVARDRVRVALAGRTLFEEPAERAVWVCGPGAYVVLKALAARSRGEPKDYYDLWYVLWHYREATGGAVGVDVASRLRPLLDAALARSALEYLAEDFATLDAVGPSRIGAFLGRGEDDAFRADIVGVVDRLLRACR